MILNTNVLIENREAIEETMALIETARTLEEKKEYQMILKDLQRERKELLKLEFNL